MHLTDPQISLIKQLVKSRLAASSVVWGSEAIYTIRLTKLHNKLTKEWVRRRKLKDDELRKISQEDASRDPWGDQENLDEV